MSGTDEYVLGTPYFKGDEVASGKWKAKLISPTPNNGDDKRYISSMTLNVKDHTKNYVTHQDLMNGASITFKMDPNPNEQRGTKTVSLILSLTNLKKSYDEETDKIYQCGYAGYASLWRCRLQITMSECMYVTDAIQKDNRRKFQTFFPFECGREEILRVQKLLKNAQELAWMFANCSPIPWIQPYISVKARMANRIHSFYTGDIHAMWLRDSGA